MDIDALRVFNILNNLGITEQEFSEIEEEQKQQCHTGLAIITIKKDNVFIAVSHDENHEIVIKEIEGKIKPIPKSRILFKALTTIWNLPNEIYSLHRIAQYRSLDSEIKYRVETLEKLKDRICDRFTDEYPKELGEMYDDVYQDFKTREKNGIRKPQLVEEQLRALYWLFDEQFENIKIPESRPNITRILKVFTRNNRRVALLGTYEKWNKKRGSLFSSCQWSELINRTTFKIASFTPSKECYNFVNPEREIYLRNEFDDKTDIWISEELQGIVSLKELKILSQRFNCEWILLTADEFNKQRSSIRIEMLNAQKEEQGEKAKNRLVKSIKKQFNSGSVTRYGISFSPKSVEYNGIKFTGNKIGYYLIQHNVLVQERPEFNNIFEGYVELILNLEVIHNCNDYSVKQIYSRFQGSEKLSFNNIKVSIEQRGNSVYVNGYRICREDLKPVVMQILKCKGQNDFNEFLNETSHCNLKLQEIIRNGGVIFQLQYSSSKNNCLSKDDNDEELLLTIPVNRRGTNNYASIGGVEYRIRDINALIEIGKKIQPQLLSYRGGNLQRTIRLLYKAIEGISPIVIGGIIENGILEHKKMSERIRKENSEKIERSKEFISHAIKLTNAKKTDKGYIVRGESETIYFVNEKDLGVWTIKNGEQNKYLCIVDNDYENDDRNRDALRNDRIAKRLLMLSKDIVVAQEVFQRGDKMDSHWLEIKKTIHEEEISEVA